MNVLRKIIGALVLLFIGIPILFGIIWGVGIAKGALSANFYRELPQIISSEIPNIVDELIEEAKENPNSSDMDEESRRWLEAVSKTGIPFKEVMRKSGLTSWFEEDFSDAMYLLGKVLSGKSDYKSVYLSLGKLKKAISSDYLADYLSTVVKNLPACSQTEEKFWALEVSKKDFIDNFPDCNPQKIDKKSLKEFFKSSLQMKVKEIPEKVDLLSDNSLGVRADSKGGDFFSWNYRDNERKINFIRAFNTYSYLLFIIPFVFIFLGAVIADSTLPGFLLWSGGATTLGGVLSLLLHSLVSGVVKAVGILPTSSFSVYYNSNLTSVESIVHRRVMEIVNQILSELFSKVSHISFSIILLGIALIALSFIVKNERGK